MTQVYFHCSNTKKVFVDYRGAVVDDLAEAHDHATSVVRSFANERSLADWGDWVLTSATTRAMSSSLCPSLSCSASRIKDRYARQSLCGHRKYVAANCRDHH